MPVRRVIEIDEERCNGCGICVEACHEGAIGLIDGKAKLLRDDYCDGLGDCLPACPVDAISFVEREAAAYDEAAVAANMAKKDTELEEAVLQKADAPRGCPGSMARDMRASRALQEDSCTQQSPAKPHLCADDVPAASELDTWPIQIKLAPVNAPYFEGADLLVAADCTPFAYAGFHSKFLRDRTCLIGCPKLDDVDYSEKLATIISNNDIRSITVVRMVVPCCGGLENAVRRAIEQSGKIVPLAVATISLEGDLL